MQIAKALLHLNAAGAGLNRRGLRRSDIDAPSAEADLRLPANIRDANIGCTTGERQIAAEITGLYVASAAGDLHRPGQIVQLDQTRTRRSHDRRRNRTERQRATARLHSSAG